MNPVLAWIDVPSGKLVHYGKIHHDMEKGKSTIKGKM